MSMIGPAEVWCAECGHLSTTYERYCSADACQAARRLADNQRAIESKCDEIKAFLKAKNRAYGDSVLNPVRAFSSASPQEQIGVRIDDKLSRLARGGRLPEESLDDTIIDLTGYLVMLMIARGIELKP